MVSRRNYLTIAMMFVILLFMFQFTGVMKEQLSEYESNEYADDTTTSFQRSDAFLAEQTSADACEAIYVGEAGGAEESVVKTWCSYRKRTFFCSSSFALLDSLQDDALQVLVVDGSKVTSEEEVAVLRREAQMGVTVIFATLPQSSVIREYRDLRELLGIRAVIADEIPLAGMHLFSGFLLGGEEIYEVTEPAEEERQDMNPSVPWYTTGAGTKTSMEELSFGGGAINDWSARCPMRRSNRRWMTKYGHSMWEWRKKRQKTAFCLPFSGETVWTRQRFSV